MCDFTRKIDKIYHNFSLLYFFLSKLWFYYNINKVIFNLQILYFPNIHGGERT